MTARLITYPISSHPSELESTSAGLAAIFHRSALASCSLLRASEYLASRALENAGRACVFECGSEFLLFETLTKMSRLNRRAFGFLDLQDGHQIGRRATQLSKMFAKSGLLRPTLEK